MAVITETADGRHHDPAVHDRHPPGGPRGPACAHRGDALAREGDRRGPLAGRAAGRRCRRSPATGRTEYDWRKCEARLNAVPQFITEIDGLDIHFVHVRSKHEDALPLVVCHGWPGSFIEQMKIVDLLTDPTAHGGSASDAFHVVIPNMPGYGFSGKPTETGWDPIHIGNAWVELMKRLGYTQFVAAGRRLGRDRRRRDGGPRRPLPPCAGTAGAARDPLQLPRRVSARASTRRSRPAPRLPSDLSADERRAVEADGERLRDAGQAVDGRGARRRCTDWLTHPSPWPPGCRPRPDQLPDADRPRLPRRGEGGLTRDDILDNITLFWLTNTGVSSARHVLGVQAAASPPSGT